MQNLTNINQMCDKYKLNFKVVKRLVDAAKLSAVFSAPYGKGHVTYYDLASLEKLIRDYVTAESDKGPPAPILSLTSVEKRLDVIDATLSDMSTTHSDLADAVKRVEDQNKVIFGLLSKLMSELGAKV